MKDPKQEFTITHTPSGKSIQLTSRQFFAMFSYVLHGYLSAAENESVIDKTLLYTDKKFVKELQVIYQKITHFSHDIEE